jgi:hypothetical protein
VLDRVHGEFQNAEELAIRHVQDPAGASAPLTEFEAAGRLGLKVATLRAWRHQRRGPAFIRLGRAIRYLPRDVEAFLRANRHGVGTDGGR